MKPKVFVASSVEGLSIGYAVQQNLHHIAEVTIWDQGVFQLSASALESLLLILQNSDFGIFVFSPDDVAKIRGTEYQAVRDNVLFELGLFVGRIGKSRCFIFLPEKSELRIPTDLIGLTPAHYETNRSDNNQQAACGPGCHQVRLQIQTLGFLSGDVEAGRGAPETPVAKESQRPEKLDTNEKEKLVAPPAPKADWIAALIAKDYPKAHQIVAELLAESTSDADRRQHEIQLALIDFDRSLEDGVREFEQLLKKYPKEDLYEWYSSAFTWVGLHNKALEIVERGLVPFPDSAILLGLKGTTLLRMGDREAANAFLEQSITKFSTIGDLYALLARSYSDTQQPKKARNRLIRGLDQIPQSETLLSQYASLLSDEGDNIGAIAVYNRLIIRHENNPGYHTLLGNAYLNLQMFNLALESYHKGNTLADGKQAWIVGNIGNIFSARGFFSEAIAKFNEALKLDPDSQYSHERLALAMAGRTAEANRLQQLLNSAPTVFSEVPEEAPNESVDPT